MRVAEYPYGNKLKIFLWSFCICLSLKESGGSSVTIWMHLLYLTSMVSELMDWLARVFLVNTEFPTRVNWENCFLYTVWFGTVSCVHEPLKCGKRWQRTFQSVKQRLVRALTYKHQTPLLQLILQNDKTATTLACFVAGPVDCRVLQRLATLNKHFINQQLSTEHGDI